MEQDGTSALLADGVQRAAISGGKQVLKIAAAPVLNVARASRVFGLARGSTLVGEALNHHLARDKVLHWELDLSEPARTLQTLAGSDAIAAPRPVTAKLVLLDATGDTISFCKNHVIDNRGLAVLERVVNEDGDVLPFRDLRVGRVPLESPHRVRGSIAYLSNSGVDNFGHWLNLTFPLIQYYRQYLGGDPDFYYIGNPVQSWHYESLAAVGVDAAKVLTEAVIGDRMLFACVDDHIPFPTQFLDFTTSMLRRAYDPASPKRRIFISRSKARTRRILNENACREVLQQHGFEPFWTEDLSLADETKLFASAEAVVGFHGAGLNNLLFCHAGTVALELYAYGYASPWFDATWFPEISAARGIVYGTLYGEPAESARYWGVQPRDYDAVIDPGKLDAILRRVDSVLDSRSFPAAVPAGNDGI